jgi:hypothetical protein
MSSVEIAFPKDSQAIWHRVLPAQIETLRADPDINPEKRARAIARQGTSYFGVFRTTQSGLDKVVSLFEPHTEIIRKGKLAKPTEFGRVVKIQEAEAQFITDYEVCERGQTERALWAPALDRRIALFDHVPQLGSRRRRLRVAE